MKILNLYLKNINSLEGENRIDFEQPPFTETGVFAITGPNGSGKTSILDAITLALYGETFRFDKPARHVITQQTDESCAQIEFALDGEKYRSSWRVKRDPASTTGDVLPSEMRLVKISPMEEILGTSVQQVCDKVAELTGMNFRSFTRSILLAQGDFAAFLNALDNERMAILEKIINTDIYEDYKRAADGKVAEAKKQLGYLQEDLAAVALISPEAMEACELDLADFSEEVADYQEIINRLETARAAYSESDALKAQIAAKEKQMQQAISLRLEVQKKLARLQEGEIAQSLVGDIAEADLHKQAVEHAQAELTKLQKELAQLEATLALPDFALDTETIQAEMADRQAVDIGEQRQALDALRGQISLVNANWQSEVVLQKTLTDQIAEKQGVLAGVDEWLAAHVQDSALLDDYPALDKLKAVRRLRAELAEKKKALAKWSKSTQAALQKNKNEFDSKTARLAELKTKLAEAETALATVSPDHSLEQVLDLQAEQKERVKNFQDMLNLALANEKLRPQPTLLDRLFGKSQLPDRVADELEQELEGIKAQIKMEENIRLTLERSLFNDALIARMAHDRAYLNDGKPCPLCGATEHPYSSHPPATGNSKQALADQRIKLKRLLADAKNLEEQLAFAQKRADRNQVNNLKVQQIRGLWQTLCNKLNVATQELDITNTGLMKSLLAAEESELKNIGMLLDGFKSAQSQVAKLNLQIEKTTQDLERIKPVIDTIEGEWQSGPDAIRDNEDASLRADQEEVELSARLVEQLTLLGSVLPIPGQEDILDGQLSQRRLDYQSYAARKQELTDEIGLLTAKLTAGQAQIDTYRSRAEAVNQRLRLEETVSLHIALVEKQKLVADKEGNFHRLVAEAEAFNEAVAIKLQDTPFNTLADVEEMLASLPEQAKLAEQHATLESEIASWGAELDKLDQRLVEQASLLEAQQQPEEIDRQIQEIQNKMELAQMETLRLEAVIREQKALRQKHVEIADHIQTQQDLVNQASAELAELTADNGIGFRRKAQENLVGSLLSHTNAILEKINGRYYVRQKADQPGLALEIEDTFQANLRRSPKSLSGGEGFIVSLALALGLSAVASQGRSVDSLFLDEGFGNLDAETLFVVINTLEGLRAQGKMVGVISHVEAVQKSFKAQLQLVKKANGLGELRKVS